MKIGYKKVFIKESLEAFGLCIEDGLIETPGKFPILYATDTFLTQLEDNHVSKREINGLIEILFPLILREFENCIYLS